MISFPDEFSGPSGMSLVVSENYGGNDEEIQYRYFPNDQLDLQYVRYVQYVRLKTTLPTGGLILYEVEVYAFGKFIDSLNQVQTNVTICIYI